MLDNYQIKLDEEPNKKDGEERVKKCNGTIPKGRIGNPKIEETIANEVPETETAAKDDEGTTMGEVEQQKSTGDDNVDWKMTTKSGGDGDKNGVWKERGNLWFNVVAG